MIIMGKPMDSKSWTGMWVPTGGAMLPEDIFVSVGCFGDWVPRTVPDCLCRESELRNGLSVGTGILMDELVLLQRLLFLGVDQSKSKNETLRTKTCLS
jgi:hypothetical protein